MIKYLPLQNFAFLKEIISPEQIQAHTLVHLSFTLMMMQFGFLNPFFTLNLCVRFQGRCQTNGSRSPFQLNIQINLKEVLLEVETRGCLYKATHRRAGSRSRQGSNTPLLMNTPLNGHNLKKVAILIFHAKTAEF